MQNQKDVSSFALVLTVFSTSWSIRDRGAAICPMASGLCLQDQQHIPLIWLASIKSYFSQTPLYKGDIFTKLHILHVNITTNYSISVTCAILCFCPHMLLLYAKIGQSSRCGIGGSMRNLFGFFINKKKRAIWMFLFCMHKGTMGCELPFCLNP